MMKPVVVIIGRPNVGKSTFFNRITRTRNALVDDFPGVTRDRHYGDACWNDKDFTVIDTGGFAESETDAFADMIREQILEAIEDADVIIHLLDGKSGVSPFDRDIVGFVRRIAKPVYYAANKIDSAEKEDELYDLYQLGLEKIYPLSAEHGYGVNDFMDVVVQSFAKTAPETDLDEIRLAVVGRPNVGKSSLVNRILGEDRQLVSAVPGTTRDAVDAVFKRDGCTYRIVDTAGIRRKARVAQKLEKFSIIKALRSLDRCHIALIVLDAEAGIADQDINVAGYAYERGCGCVFLLNKWDLVPKDPKTAKAYAARLREAAKFMSFAPVLTVSALTGLRVGRMIQIVADVFRQYTHRIGTGEANRIIQQAMQANAPSLHHGHRIKFYYATQISKAPPTLVCFVNYPDAVHFSYKRYLINQLRENTDFKNVPIRLIFRQRTGKRVITGKKSGTDRRGQRQKRTRRRKSRGSI